jgi:hypothetical protein
MKKKVFMATALVAVSSLVGGCELLPRSVHDQMITDYEDLIPSERNAAYVGYIVFYLLQNDWPYESGQQKTETGYDYHGYHY